MTARAASIGECMIELSPRQGGLFGLGFGGDTLNTAVYMARLGIKVDYLTALGDCPFSDQMLATWQAEGVGTAEVRRLPGRVPGLYLIQTDSAGERRFSYWRDRAPARELFQLPDTDALLATIESAYDLVYLSGISLSLYGDDGRAKLTQALDALRRRGGRVAFDSNYRPRNWPDVATARDTMAELLRRSDIALVSADDERALWGDPDTTTTAKRIQALGVGEVVVKSAGDSAVLLVKGARAATVPPERDVKPVDSTAAGDSFNAAYLAARLADAPPLDSARSGHRLAAAVIQHPGAVIPRQAMPSVI